MTEKFELLDALWHDIESAPMSSTAEQSAELDRREATYEKNPTAVIPWEQVKTDIYKR